MLRRLAIAVLVLVLVSASALTWNYLRPIPAIAATSIVPAEVRTPGAPPALPWPARGSAAVAVSGLGLLASSGNEQPAPTASVAKVMTALLILQDKPLKPGESGPSITVTAADVLLYQRKKAAEESVLKVVAGEQLTELQALTALMLPSANNIADLLAFWDAGSVDSFLQKMNQKARQMGLQRTSFADTHGADARTVSTPTELVALGMAAMQDPVLAGIVGMVQADLPVAGTVYNVDYVLGQSGIIGIKTGSGGDLGANFLWAATASAGGHPVTLFGCVMGQGSLDQAFNATKALIAAMPGSLRVERVIAKNQRLGDYRTPWGGSTALLATADVDLVQWPGMVVRQRLTAPDLTITKPLPAGTAAGTELVLLGDYRVEVPVVTESSLYPPGRTWRLTRIRNG